MKSLISGLIIILIVLTAPAATLAQQAGTIEEGNTAAVELEAIHVEGQRPITAYSDRIIRSKDFMNFPRQNPSDLVRLIPGIHINQHTGGGKAHQYFLRGFDAEHGQDLAGYFMGIPLNEPSQMHGQGYLDLFFLIPETLASVQMVKGPYMPEYGNFAVAGAVDFIPASLPEHNRVKLTYGSFNTFRALGQAGLTANDTDIHLAADYKSTEGFTDPGDMESQRAFLMITRSVGDSNMLKILATYYDSDYDAADVVPVKWVALERTDRFDAIDDSDGGESYRSILAVAFSHDDGNLNTGARVYYQDRKSVIFSNYTYYFLNPQKGDQYEMNDRRDIYGADLWLSLNHKILGKKASTKAGINLRSDHVDQAQYNTIERERWNTISNFEFTESSTGVYLKQFFWPAEKVQLMYGLRYDRVFYDIEGTQDIANPVQTLDDRKVETRTWSDVVSPKVSLVYTPIKDGNGPIDSLDIFANYGIGFYSGRAQEKAYPPSDHDVPRARMYEVAARAGFLSGKLTVAGGYWVAEKEEELVFSPEVGYSTSRGESRREGQDLEIRYQPVSWLYLATDFYHTEAWFEDTDEDIPGTPEWLLTQMLSFRHPSGFHGSARIRWEGERPLLNNDHSREYWVADVLAGYEADKWSAELAVDNVFNREWDDTSFSYTSRPTPGGPLYEGLHMTPGTPCAARVSISYYF